MIIKYFIKYLPYATIVAFDAVDTIRHSFSLSARQAARKKLDILAIKFWKIDNSKNSGDLSDSN